MAAALHHATGDILNVAAIVLFFGGPDEISTAFKKHKLPSLTPYAVKQWMHRQRIPLHRQINLQTLAVKQGKKLDLSRYFIPEYKVLAKRKRNPKAPAKKVPPQPSRTRASAEAR
jgi:hypothetical protein